MTDDLLAELGCVRMFVPLKPGETYAAGIYEVDPPEGMRPETYGELRSRIQATLNGDVE